MVEGKVISETGQGIPQVYIGIPTKRYGITSDFDGNFSIGLNQEHLHDTIKFVAYGFKTKFIPVTQLITTKELVIKLKDDYFVLNEVVIYEDKKEKKIRPIAIVEKAINRINRNYPAQPFGFQAFYRTSYKENNTYVRFLEGLVTVFDEGYRTPSSNLANIKIQYNNLRSSVDGRKYPINDDDGYVDVIFRAWDDIRARQRTTNPDNLTFWKFTLDSIYQWDNTRLYAISGSMKASIANNHLPKQISVLIEDSTFAFLEIESDYSTNTSLWGPFAQKTEDYYVKNIGYKSTYKYQKYQNKYFMNYNFFSQSYAVHDAADDSLLATYSIDEETILYQHLAYDSIPEDMLTHTERYRYPYGYELYDSVPTYDTAFWNPFNTLFQTNLSKQIQADLGSYAHLETSFSKASTIRETNQQEKAEYLLTLKAYLSSLSLLTTTQVNKILALGEKSSSMKLKKLVHCCKDIIKNTALSDKEKKRLLLKNCIE